MYAYKQQYQEKSLQSILPEKKRLHQVKRVQKKAKVKKINPFKEFLRLSVVLSFLSLFAIFILPTAYNSLIKQVFFPTSIPIKNGYENVMLKNENPAFSTDVDLYSLSNPTTNYLYNGLVMNRQLLIPTIQKMHSEVTTMYQSSELTSLKQELMNLMTQYPSIKPSIYAWEYDKGQYVSINADKLYSAASIIKLPVLVRLFKSIEANQLTIYDEMPLLEQYRSSGSGDLQYARSGNMYSMDYLAKIMIQDSDNTSTNMIMSKLGGMDDINTGLRDWGFSKTYVKTWLPDLKGTNKTTALDMAKLLYNLDNPGFLNINSREYIINYMSHVKNNRLIQAGLGDGALFIHKTGDIGTVLGDAGIVYAPSGKKYIVVILAQRPYNSPLGKDFIVKASSLIYKALAE